jgi:hypothetical protein
VVKAIAAAAPALVIHLGDRSLDGYPLLLDWPGLIEHLDEATTTPLSRR